MSCVSFIGQVQNEILSFFYLGKTQNLLMQSMEVIGLGSGTARPARAVVPRLAGGRRVEVGHRGKLLPVHAVFARLDDPAYGIAPV